MTVTRVRHLVLFRLASDDPQQRSSDIEEMSSRLEALVGQIEGLESLQVRPGLGGEGQWDAALVSEHSSLTALQEYQRHPAHVDVVSWVATVVKDRAVVDVQVD